MHDNFETYFTFSSASILKELTSYARGFSLHIGVPFGPYSIVLTAYTGCAATEIGGETVTRAFGLAKSQQHATNDDLNQYRNIRMIIVDEVSFLDHDLHLKKLSNNLQMFTQCRDYKYGKRPIVFLGDFRQLSPVGGTNILSLPNSLYWTEAINCLVELKGTHRFKKCKEMSEIMSAMHQVGLSSKHREMLNSRVINGTTVRIPSTDKSRIATFRNSLRSHHNRDIFREYLLQKHSDCDEYNIPKTALIIKSKMFWGKSNQPLNPTFRKVVFEYCTDADIENSRKKKCDPFLTLIKGCPLMGTENTNVSSGVANGTCATFEQAIFKTGKKAKPIKLYGKWVYSIDIDDVSHLILRWTDSQYRGTFKVFPKKGSFAVRFPIWDDHGRIKRLNQTLNITHFPVLLNYATTGHKLQGKSLDHLIISEWNATENWAYVVLSRVRTLDGLFLFEPIPLDINFEPSEKYKNMMKRLRTKLAKIEDVQDLYVQ